MNLEVKRILTRKAFRNITWAYSELKELYKFVSKNKIYTNTTYLRIITFKENGLKCWYARMNKINARGSTKNDKLNFYLKYGRLGLSKYENYINKVSYNSSKEGLIEKYGEDKANEMCFKRGAPFRDSNIQRNNALKLKQRKLDNPEKYIGSSTTQLEYYTKRGYSDEDARVLLKDRQTTFSLAKCIETHGAEKGTESFKARQKKWQETLNNKPQDEIDSINRKKNACLILNNETKEEFFKRLNRIGKTIIYDSDDLRKYIKAELKRPKWKYLSKKEFIKNLPFCGNSLIKPIDILNEINFDFPRTNLIFKNGRCYTLSVPEGYLRSSLEIDFYFKLKERSISFCLEKRYKHSKIYKTDFYISEFDLYIEIAGTVNDKQYDEKMKLKETLFDALILTPKTQNRFFKRIDTHGFNGIKSYIRGII